jgi:hypothetical protein
VIAVLAIAGVVVYKFALGDSDEDQIKGVVKTLTDDYNNADGAGMATLYCGQATKGPRGSKALIGLVTSEMLREDLDEYGTVATSVTDIRVTGDRATAVVTTTRSKSPNDVNKETDPFVKENGGWKVCPAS